MANVGDVNVRVTADPQFGQLVMKPDGLFTYKPVRGYSGSDNFTYIVDDGQQDSAEAMVNISIGELSTGELPENVAPNLDSTSSPPTTP